ncbi:MAG: hypothetical protein ACTHK0_14705 [Ginsengibacter sp.]
MTKEQHLEFIKRDINKAKRSGMLLEVTLLTKGCCEECEKIDGKTMSLKEAIKTKPLPHLKCTRTPSCFCCYTFHPLRDAKGKLIKVKKKWWQIFFMNSG